MNDSNELLSTSKYSFFINDLMMKLKIRPSSLMFDAVHDVWYRYIRYSTIWYPVLYVWRMVIELAIVFSVFRRVRFFKWGRAPRLTKKGQFEI